MTRAPATRAAFTVAPPWPCEPVEPSTRDERLRWYASVARWAPSKHNTQPWRFLLDGEGVEVWSDPVRVLADSDPHQRELLIGCGAATHLLAVAARAHGRRPRVEVLPDGRSGCVARVVEDGPWATTEDDRALLAAVPRRRTDRGPLDDAPLPPALPFSLQTTASELGTVLRLVTSPGDRATLASLVERADRAAARDGRAAAELRRWSRDPGDARGDGVPADHARSPAASWAAEFVQRDFSSPAVLPAQDRDGVDHPLVGVLCTHEDRPVDWVRAGTALAAVLLRAQVTGASASFLDQPVELPAFRALLREHLALPGAPQVVLRLGVGGDVTPTPRRAQDEVVVTGQP